MGFKILPGDCRVVLKDIPDSSIDSVVSDPPSGIKMMGKEWDHFKPDTEDELAAERATLMAFQNFLVEVFIEVYRVLKPGAFGLVWALPRTSHHTGMALERSGFEIRDRFSHVFGCLSEDTELLTENGWEQYPHLRVGTLAMCYDLTTDSFSWQPIQEVYVYPYNDTAYNLRGDLTDQLISRGHRCVVERGGKPVLEYAEALKQQESVPILENVSDLLEALPLSKSHSGTQKQGLFQRVCKCKNREAEQEVQNTLSSLSAVWSSVSPKEPCINSKSQVLQSFMPSSNLCHNRTNGESGGTGSLILDSRSGGVSSRKDVRRIESSLEGWGDNTSLSGELCGVEVCEVPTGVHRDGREEWVCRGASIDSSQNFRAFPNEVRNCSSYQSQPEGQSSRKSYAVCYQSGSQVVRASRFTTPDLVRVETTHYKGMVWCIRTTTGCFVARRLGKAFVTGNSGYKKGLDIKKALLAEGLPEEAEKWIGHHTGVKPAMEDWWLIRKPISGRVIDNLLKYGTGTINIDSARIYTDWNEVDRPDSWKKSGFTSKPEASKVAAPPGQGIECHPLGRWPADFILSHSLGCRKVGYRTLKGDQRGDPGGRRPGGFYNTGSDVGDGKPNAHVYGNENLPIYECAPGCPIRILEEQEPGASRFFKVFEPEYEDPFRYLAKPSPKEKNADLDEELINEHPTVKSLKLMRYLVKLATPSGGVVIDPFAGSGTTLVAAIEDNFDCIGIENDPETLPVLMNRVKNAHQREEARRTQEEGFSMIFDLESE